MDHRQHFKKDHRGNESNAEKADQTEVQLDFFGVQKACHDSDFLV